MQYKTTIKGDYTIIALTGEIDLQTSPEAREQLLELLKDRRHVLVDLSGVAYIDSSGIASLVEALQFAKSNSLFFGLVDLSEAAQQVIRLARLDKVFALYDTIEEALAAAG
jgi:anti-sigma B factor antagonist